MVDDSVVFMHGAIAVFLRILAFNRFFIFFISFFLFNIGCLTLVGQRPMKSLSSVCPSVRPSVCPSLSFLKIRSLVVSDILHDDS